VSFLLDTNVVSEARKPRGNQNVKGWLDSVPGDDLYLSVLTVGEIRRGIENLRSRDRAQAIVFETWLMALQDGYADRLLPVTTEIAEMWGRLNVPDRIPAVDGLMAATARVHNMTLVTRDTTALARSGVQLLDPFLPVT
jgi:predicted nucleic acid-binding protein